MGVPKFDTHGVELGPWCYFEANRPRWQSIQRLRDRFEECVGLHPGRRPRPVENEAWRLVRPTYAGTGRISDLVHGAMIREMAEGSRSRTYLGASDAPNRV